MAEQAILGYRSRLSNTENQTGDGDYKIVRVKIIGGQGLAYGKISFSRNPYVMIELVSTSNSGNESVSVIDTARTTTKTKTLQPKWEEEFLFRVLPTEHKLLIKVFDHQSSTVSEKQVKDTLEDDFIGMVSLSLESLPQEAQPVDQDCPQFIHRRNYDLQPSTDRNLIAKSKIKGSLSIYVAFIPIPVSNQKSLKNMPENPPPEFQPKSPTTDDLENPPEQIFGNPPMQVSENRSEETLEISEIGFLQTTAGSLQIEPEETHFLENSTVEPFEIPSEEIPEDHPQDTVTIVNVIRKSSCSSEKGQKSENSPIFLTELTHFEEQKPENLPWNTTFEVETETETVTVTEASIMAVTGTTIDPEIIPNANLQVLPKYETEDQAGADTELNLGQGQGQGQGQKAPAFKTFGDSFASANDGDFGDEFFDDEDEEIYSFPPVAPLPPGWEERIDCDGRTYFCDHNTKTTHWERPPPPPRPLPGTLNGGPAREFQTQIQAAAITTDDTDEGDDQIYANGVTIVRNSSELPSGWTEETAPNGRKFFIDHVNETTTWVDPRSGMPSSAPDQLNSEHTPIPKRPEKRSAKNQEENWGPLPSGWEQRIHTNGRIFFIDHNTKTTQFEDPRLPGNIVPFSYEFKQKYGIFKEQLSSKQSIMQIHVVPKRYEIRVNRKTLLEDSYKTVAGASSELLKMKLWIVFEGEPCLDYGGLTREWFDCLSKDIFNPHNGLFEYTVMGDYALQINPGSGLYNGMHLDYFKFIGRVTGMAVFHGQLLDIYLTLPFYKRMLENPIELEDLKTVDWAYYKSLQWILENDPEQLELTFTIDDETISECTHVVDLKPQGATIPVTNDNKDEYVKLVVEWRYVCRVKKQMDAFLLGFTEIIPLSTLKIFNESELERLLCGLQCIDVQDWKQNTVYKGDYHPNHVVMQWFWKVILSFNNEMRVRLLQFVTGSSRVPMNGFRQLYGSNGLQLFTITNWGTPSNYPRAHTCFNRLDLPPYESYDQLREKLVKAVEETQGFADVD